MFKVYYFNNSIRTCGVRVHTCDAVCYCAETVVLKEVYIYMCVTDDEVYRCAIITVLLVAVRIHSCSDTCFGNACIENTCNFPSCVVG